PRGRKTQLNECLQALGEVQARLEAIGDRPAEYLRAQAARVEVEAAVQQVERARNEAAARLSRLERLEAALPALEGLAQVELELGALPDLSTFPPDAGRRLEDLTVAAEELTRERERLADQVALSAARLEAL